MAARTGSKAKGTLSARKSPQRQQRNGGGNAAAQPNTMGWTPAHQRKIAQGFINLGTTMLNGLQTTGTKAGGRGGTATTA